MVTSQPERRGARFASVWKISAPLGRANESTITVGALAATAFM